jgi:transcriptional regulator with XRE-family HTH domain
MTTKLQKLLDLRGTSQRYIAKAANRTPHMIYKYAKGFSTPGADAAYAIANELGVSVFWLFLDGKDGIDDYEEEKRYVTKDAFQRMSGLS